MTDELKEVFSYVNKICNDLPEDKFKKYSDTSNKDVEEDISIFYHYGHYSFEFWSIDFRFYDDYCTIEWAIPEWPIMENITNMTEFKNFIKKVNEDINDSVFKDLHYDYLSLFKL